MNKKIWLRTTVLISLCLLVPFMGAARSEGLGDKDAYTMTLSATQRTTTTDVTVSIASNDLGKYPLPSSLKKLQAFLKTDHGPDPQKYSDSDVPLVNGQTTFTVQLLQPGMSLRVQVHFKPPGVNDQDLTADVTIPLGPDLQIDKVDAPKQVVVNAPFNVNATVRETNGATGATAVVTLYDAGVSVSSQPNVVVPKGGKVAVVFQGVRATTAGTHSYVVKISDATPAESDLSDNSYAFTIAALLEPDLTVKGVIAPQQVFVKSAFDVQATIQENSNLIGATATVSLCDGPSVLATSRNVVVPQGGTVTVTFSGIVVTGRGPDTYTVKISNSKPDESDETNNSYAFSINAVLRPDLRVDKLNAPDNVAVNAPFGIQAVIREVDKGTGATATVSLFDGTTQIGSSQSVSVLAGGTATVTFTGIVASTKGPHDYTVRISNANPAESDVSNNSASFHVDAKIMPELQFGAVTAPQVTPRNVPFAVQAVLKEVLGQIGASATITLYDGQFAIGVQRNIAVQKGGSTTVNFTGITPVTLGVHAYTLKITDCDPDEFDKTNDTYTFSVSVKLPPDLRFDAITATSPAIVGMAFSVTANVREIVGQMDATATVTLFENSSVIGAPQSVSVVAGGTGSAVFSPLTESSAGTHTYTIRISNSNPAETNITNNDTTFKVVILPRPDLAVTQVVTNPPQQVVQNTPFDVTATIRELTNQTGATATVKLYDGINTIGAPRSVTLSAGQSVDVLFQGVSFGELGTHTCSVSITGSQPPDSNPQNDLLTFAVTVVAPTPMQSDMPTYSYEVTGSGTISARFEDRTYDYADSMYAATSSMSFRAVFPTGGKPLTQVDEISWTISNSSGVFDSAGIGNPSTNATNSLTVKNIAATINSTAAQTEVLLQESYTYTRVVDTRISMDQSSGSLAYVLPPAGVLTVTVRVRSGANAWVGTSSVNVPPPQPVTPDSYSKTFYGTDHEDGVSPYLEIWSYSHATAVPAQSQSVAGRLSGQITQDLAQSAGSSLPKVFSLSQNYPNPFNPTTTIAFTLPKSTYVSLKVYDILAREVASLASSEYAAGEYRIQWNASRLPSGTYIYRLQAGDFVSQKKLVLIK